MTEAVYRRFPDHSEIIKDLLKKDTTFQEICIDYQELSALLVDYCRLEGLASVKYDHIGELIRDLEGEIINRVKNDQANEG